MFKDALKHYAKKLLGRPDAKWPFQRLQKRIPVSTLKMHRSLVLWAEESATRAAEQETLERYASDNDPLIRQGGLLASSVREAFRGKYSGVPDLRILVHVPAASISPAGASLFGNLAESLAYLGVPVEILAWDESIEQHLTTFNPTVFITGDNQPYLARINWDAVKRYRQSQPMRLGLTASLPEDGNTPLKGRLKWAHEHGVDFYYAFRATEYLRDCPGYAPFHEEGYRIISVEFGANPLLYFPVPGVQRDIDYIFMGSGNYDRYLAFFPDIVTRHTGFLAGKGWARAGWVPPRYHRYLYARAKIGLNIHGPFQIEAPCELTERTYILAACGVPQLIDNPKLLPERFSEDCFFVAADPQEYYRLFKEILASPEKATNSALKAQREVFEKHTTFHRADGFLRDIMSLCSQQDKAKRI